MVKITEGEVDKTYMRVYLNQLNSYQSKNPNNLPTHYTMTQGDNGFDQVKYYRLNLDTR